MPINGASAILSQLRAHGRVSRGYMGVTLKHVDTDLQRSLDLHVDHGALVQEVAGGSPAEKAGLQKGDVVKAVDGMPIRSAAQLRNLIGLTPLGGRVELRIERNGAVHSASVEVGSARAPARRTADQ